MRHFKSLLPSIFLLILISANTCFATEPVKFPFDPMDKKYDYEKADVWISSNVLSRVDLDDLQGAAMVCALSSEDSYLSYRVEPNARAQEMMRLGEFSVLELTGKHSDDYRWLEAEGFYIETDRTGHDIPSSNTIIAKGKGWVNSAYVCDFVN